MATRAELIQKAKERGYELVMTDGDENWYSFYSRNHKLNLEVHVGTAEFTLLQYEGIIKITTGKCGSFMADSHFKRIERQILDVLTSVRER